MSAVVAALSLALPLAAQAPPAEIPVVDETIDARVVNVEAVVTDASGRRVRGLSAGDFRLLVDGREVPVEYFTEVEEGRRWERTKPPPRPRPPWLQSPRATRWGGATWCTWTTRSPSSAGAMTCWRSSSATSR